MLICCIFPASTGALIVTMHYYRSAPNVPDRQSQPRFTCLDFLYLKYWSEQPHLLVVDTGQAQTHSQELQHGFRASWKSRICERKLHYPGNRTQDLLLSVPTIIVSVGSKHCKNCECCQVSILIVREGM